MKPLADCRLYTFVDTAYLNNRVPEVVAKQLCDGGSDLIQLRAKGSSPEDVRRMAEKIVSITKRANVGLVINDYPDIAHDISAEFCHLGQEDFEELKIKKVELKIGFGLSTHSPDQARKALQTDADYIAVGPVFATGTKPSAKPVTLDYVRWAATNANVPWFAIGGIHLKNVDDILSAGAKRICVVSAILNAQDVAKACMEFRRRLDS
jgi:thiamine-phosphate pyrophosphorylase